VENAASSTITQRKASKPRIPPAGLGPPIYDGSVYPTVGDFIRHFVDSLATRISEGKCTYQCMGCGLPCRDFYNLRVHVFGQHMFKGRNQHLKALAESSALRQCFAGDNGVFSCLACRKVMKKGDVLLHFLLKHPDIV